MRDRGRREKRESGGAREIMREGEERDRGSREKRERD